MTARIEITYKDKDTRASAKHSWLKNFGLFNKVSEVLVYDVFTVDKDLSPSELEKAADLLANPVVQNSQVITKIPHSQVPLNDSNKFYPKDFSFVIEVAFLPGVTDNVGGTAREIIEDALKIKFKEGESVYSSQLFIFEGTLNQNDAKLIADNLINVLIHRVFVKSNQQFKKNKGMEINIPKVHLKHTPKVTEVKLEIDDGNLQSIGKQGIENPDGSRRGPLALRLDYMKSIQTYFRKQRRNPTDVELEMLAQTWSEHCKHTIFADPIDEIKDGLFKTYIKGATEKIKHPFCISVFKDNSGAIEFDKDFLITHKVETHNTPSALEPYGGAITGIVGVNRDTIGFGLGAKPIANTYGFMLADPKKDFHLYRSPNKENPMLSPRRIMDGVISGVNVGGNCSGIPTPQGFLYFDDSYAGKPLVFCGTVGLIPKKIGSRNSWEKKAKSGDLIVMVGGRVGLDGIHGATFSSEEIDKGSPASAVQIGDPITQKKFSDAIVKEARDLNLFNSITDNGAGGLSSSIGEMANESGGCLVNLDKVPLKYSGLDPWQIWISESQERMTLAVPKNKWKKFFSVMQSRGVEATAIGEFTKSGRCVVKYGKQTVVDLDLEFLHDGLPKTLQKTRKFSDSVILASSTRPGSNKAQDSGGTKASQNDMLISLLRSLNITSYEFISDQYDHVVLSNNVVTPLQGKGRVNGEASVIKPLYSSNKGLVLSQGFYPSYSNLDPYNMAAASIDSAIRNVVAMGADPGKIALLDNFCWCSSDDPERLWQLKMAAKACFDFAVAFKTPFISGKDSMFNDFKGFDKNGDPVKISVLPTLLISSLGIIDDVSKAVTIDFKNPGDLIYLLGETFDEMGGSEFYFSLSRHSGKSTQLFEPEPQSRRPESWGGKVPEVSAKKNLKLYQSYFKTVQKGIVASAIAVTKGGFAVALAKSAIAGKLGVNVKVESDSDSFLFSESQGRILVSIAKEDKKEFEKIMRRNKVELLGRVRENGRFRVIGGNGKAIISTNLEKMTKLYKETFKDF